MRTSEEYSDFSLSAWDSKLWMCIVSLTLKFTKLRLQSLGPLSERLISGVGTRWNSLFRIDASLHLPKTRACHWSILTKKLPGYRASSEWGACRSRNMAWWYQLRNLKKPPPHLSHWSETTNELRLTGKFISLWVGSALTLNDERSTRSNWSSSSLLT